jgi:hypothetical protein
VGRRFIFDNSLSAGEIAPDMLSRTDLAVRNEAVKTAKNVRILQGGGARRRPGTIDLAGLSTDCIIRTLGVGDDDARILVFTVGGFEERDLDGVLIASVGSAPWSTADIVHGMQVAIEQDRIVVTSRSFFPIQLVRDGATWALTNFRFADGFNSGLRQPYWRYAEPGVTIQPDDYTGGVSIEASADTFTADWVGYRLRYAGIEIEVTSYTDATHIGGNVQGTLYPTITVTVGDTTGFSVGEEVQGEDTQIKGVVAEVASGRTWWCNCWAATPHFSDHREAGRAVGLLAISVSPR